MTKQHSVTPRSSYLKCVELAIFFRMLLRFEIWRSSQPSHEFAYGMVNYNAYLLFSEYVSSTIDILKRRDSIFIFKLSRVQCYFNHLSLVVNIRQFQSENPDLLASTLLERHNLGRS